MKSTLLLIVLTCITSCPPAFADEHHDYDPNATLGAVSFPIPSCSPAQQKNFERGVALLHSFWYEEADKQFKAVAATDPHCGMAYWGQAMSLYHQLWDRPSADDVKLGAELSGKAMSINAHTPREREYIQAIYDFYVGGKDWNFEKSAKAYSTAMEVVYQRNPQDHEAAAFYALSLLGSAPDNDSTHANQKKAIDILNALFQQDRDHPGIAHYLIHACDTPQFAPEGLPAARVYAKIAPASPHALHMPSHIFARLGLWQEDIQSNVAAINAVKHNMTGMHMGAEHEVHSMDFLLYAYLQIGDDRKAKAIVDELQTIRLEDVDPSRVGYLNRMRAEFPATYVLETRNWKAAEALIPPAGAEPGQKSVTYWAQAIGAGHLRDSKAAGEAVKQYDAMLEAVRKGDQAFRAEGMETNRDEATAWMEFAKGNNDEALALLRKVADKQDKLGKGETELPAREMLADMLLEMNRPQEALAEYQDSMKVDPNRFNGLAGAAHAAELAKRPQEATLYYAQLVKNCANSESDRPELQKAKSLAAQKTTSGTS